MSDNTDRRSPKEVRDADEYWASLDEWTRLDQERTRRARLGGVACPATTKNGPGVSTEAAKPEPEQNTRAGRNPSRSPTG